MDRTQNECLVTEAENVLRPPKNRKKINIEADAQSAVVATGLGWDRVRV